MLKRRYSLKASGTFSSEIRRNNKTHTQPRFVLDRRCMSCHLCRERGPHSIGNPHIIGEGIAHELGALL